MAVNPFERFGLDIDATLPELTRVLRERIEDAQSEEEQSQLRAVWEALSGKFEMRAELVLGALPALAHAVPALSAAASEPQLAPHPLDTHALPAFPLEWDQLTEARRSEPGRIDLSTDPAFAHLAAVVLP